MSEQKSDWSRKKRSNAIHIGLNVVLLGSYLFARNQNLEDGHASMVSLANTVLAIIPTAMGYIGGNFLYQMSGNSGQRRKTAAICGLLAMGLTAANKCPDLITMVKDNIRDIELKRIEELRKSVPEVHGFQDNLDLLTPINQGCFNLSDTTALKLALA